MKPTRGRTPTGPDIGEAWHGFGIEHVLTRSVRASAAMLDATAGADVGAPYAAPHQDGPFLREVTRSPGRLRIAFTSHPFLGEKVHADERVGLGRTVTLLEALGHELHEDAPEVDADELARNFLAFIAAECRVDMELAAAAAGRRVTRDGFQTVTYALGLLGKSLGAVDHEKAIRYLQLTARSICELFERYDVLLTPTAPTPPVPIGALQPTRAEMALLRVLGRLNAGWLMNTPAISRPMAAHSYDFIGYTIPFNVTGQPAMSVPLHWNEAGLPIGMHFVGRFGDEATLFRLAGQLERAQPWADRLPVVVATD